MALRIRLLVLLVVAIVLTLAIAFPTSANPAPSCAVSGTVEGTVTVDSPIYWGPNSADLINYLWVKAGQKFLIVGIDSANAYYQIDLSCSKVWVPQGAIQPAWAVTNVVS